MKFDYKLFIEKNRGKEFMQDVIIEYEETFGGFPDKLEEEEWFIGNCLKYIDLYREYRVPDEVRDDFDWQLLFLLTCSSLAQDVKFIVPNKVILDDRNDLDLQITVSGNKITVVKLVSELFGSQIEKLYEIYISEQLHLEILSKKEPAESKALIQHRNKRYETFKLKGIQRKKIETFKTERDGLIYHYTSFDTIYQIISNKCIWASNIKYLNDKNEFKIGLNVFDQVRQNLENSEDYLTFKSDLEYLVKEIRKRSTESIFNTSFSHQGDLLSQWRAYGDNGKGVCIGINKDKFCEMLEKEVDTDLYYGFNLNYSMKDSYEFIEDSVISFLVNSNSKKESENSYQASKRHYDRLEKIIDFIWMRVLEVKDNSFFEEKEWRLLYIQDKLRQMKKIEFFPKNERLVPYIRIDLKNIPIELIRLGPCVPNNLVSKTSIEDFLKDNGLNANVEISKIPYRI